MVATLTSSGRHEDSESPYAFSQRHPDAPRQYQTLEYHGFRANGFLALENQASTSEESRGAKATALAPISESSHRDVFIDREQFQEAAVRGYEAKTSTFSQGSHSRGQA